MKKIAFTLSEVLLTLTIIGVVSAMTVPSLVSSIDEKELQAQAKKAYNTINSAITMKYGLTRQTPKDVPYDKLFDTFLAGSTAPALKYNQKVGNVVQLPDGQIMTASQGSGDNCGGSSFCYIGVDINGEDGPHFSKVTSSGDSVTGVTLVQFSDYIINSGIGGYPACKNPTKFTIASPNTTEEFKSECRDIVWFLVQDMKVTPAGAVANRYILGLQ